MVAHCEPPGTLRDKLVNTIEIIEIFSEKKAPNLKTTLPFV